MAAAATVCLATLVDKRNRDTKVLREKEEERLNEIAKAHRDTPSIICSLCNLSTTRCSRCSGHVCKDGHLCLRSDIHKSCPTHVSIERSFPPDPPTLSKEENRMSFVKKIIGKWGF
jgi:hypothetical protein